MKRKQLSLSAKSAWTAQLFILPFYLGFWFFFFSPLLESIRMSFSKVSIGDNGYNFQFVGFDNYFEALFKNTNFTTNIVNSFTNLAWQLPVIIVLSLFLAMILNQKFRGRVFIRAVFFLPVIFASGVALSMVNGDNVAASALQGTSISGGEAVRNTGLNDLLVNAGFDSKIIQIVTNISNSLFSLVWQAGIQMIIFLAGLQSVPPALYEASAIEGATAWENFWKITLPMLVPTIIINLVYTIVDNFTSKSNAVMSQVTSIISKSVSRLGLASAFAWIYFLFIAVILLVVFFVFRIVNKRLS